LQESILVGHNDFYPQFLPLKKKVLRIQYMKLYSISEATQ